MKNRIAFTLTEVLISVAIVGVIAVLVLPAIITKYQENIFSHMFAKEVKNISQAIDSLVISENKISFYDTIMYSNTKPANYENNAGRFLKKYLKISRYCGENNGDCFAENYYQYKEALKQNYNPTFEGACAALKNGSSICIVPKIGNNSITGIIDLNGPKGPNVFGRDLRTFSIDTNTTRKAISKETDEIYYTNYLVKVNEEECNSCDCDQTRPGCSTPPPPDNSCSVDRNSAQCCVTPERKAQINDPSDACCNVGDNRDSINICQTVKITTNCQKFSSGIMLSYQCKLNITGHNADSYVLYTPLNSSAKCEDHGHKIDCNTSYCSLCGRHRNREDFYLARTLNNTCYLLRNEIEVITLGSNIESCANINTTYTP